MKIIPDSLSLLPKAFLFAAGSAALVFAVPAVADDDDDVIKDYRLSSGTETVDSDESKSYSTSQPGYGSYEAGILIGCSSDDYVDGFETDDGVTFGAFIGYFGAYYDEYELWGYSYIFGLSGDAEFVNNGTVTFVENRDYASKDDDDGAHYLAETTGIVILSDNASFTNNGTVEVDGEIQLFLTDSASFTNNGTGCSFESIYLTDSASFTNNGTVSNEFCLHDNASFTNNGTITVVSWVDLDGNTSFTNNGTIVDSLYVEVYNDYEGYHVYYDDPEFLPEGSATVENNGTIGSVYLTVEVESYFYDDDETVTELLSSAKDWVEEGHLSFINRGTVTGSVSASSFVSVTLVQGSSIGGDLTLGKSAHVRVDIEHDYDDYYDYAGAYVAGEDELNIVLNANGGSSALIAGDLVLYTPTTLNVSLSDDSDDDSVSSMLYEVQLYDGELVLESQTLYSYSSESDDEDEGTETTGSLTATSGTFSSDGTTYTWALDTDSGTITVFSGALEQYLFVEDDDDYVTYDFEVKIDDDGNVTTSYTNKKSYRSKDVIEIGSNTYAVFDLSFDSFAGTISGSGELHSSSDVDFSGDISDFTGTLFIDDETFTVESDATLGSSARIVVAGTLEITSSRTIRNATSGSGTILVSSGKVSFATGSTGVATLSIAEGAKLSGGVTLTHDSSATLVLAGTLSLDASAQETVSASDSLNVEIASTASLDLSGVESVLRSGNSATIFTAGDTGALTLTFESGDIESFLLTSDELSEIADETAVIYSTSGNAVSLTLAGSLFTASGLHDGLSEIAAAIVSNLTYSDVEPGLYSEDDYLWLSGADRSNPLVSALLSGNSARVSEIIETASPLSYAAMIAVPVAAFEDDIHSILARTSLRRFEKFDRDEQHMQFYVQAQYMDVENDDADDTPTFDYDLTGMLAGADYRADRTLTVGVAVAASFGDADVHHDGGKIEIDNYRVIAYVSKLVVDRIALDFGAQLGYTDYDVKRKTVFGDVDGETDGRTVGAFINAGTILVISSDAHLYAEPFVGVNVLHTAVNDFSESGSGGLFKVDDFDETTIAASVGCNFSWMFDVAGTKSRLGFGVAYTHEFVDDVDIDSSLLAGDGTEYEVEADMLSGDRFSFSPTLDIGLTDSLGLYAGYTFSLSTDSTTAHYVNVGLRATF